MNQHDPSRTAELLTRLLGPADPELTCDECFDELNLYVELELVGDDADALLPGMRPHLEGCPACLEDHDSLAALLATESQAPWLGSPRAGAGPGR